MILTKIKGGLGNQMFQYAIAKSIAIRNNDDFKLDISFYPKQTLRKYQLGSFNIEENIASANDLIKYVANEKFWLKVKRKLKLNKNSPNGYYEEKETAIDTNTGKIVVRVNPKFYRPAEVDLLIGDPQKAKDDLGWIPETTLEELTKLMIEADLKRNKDGFSF